MQCSVVDKITLVMKSRLKAKLPVIKYFNKQIKNRQEKNRANFLIVIHSETQIRSNQIIQ